MLFVSSFLATCLLLHCDAVSSFEAEPFDTFALRLSPISSLLSNHTAISSWPSHTLWPDDWDTYWEYYMGKSEPERNHPIVLYFTNETHSIAGTKETEDDASMTMEVLAEVRREFLQGPETRKLANDVPVILVKGSIPRIHHSVRSGPSLLWLEPRRSSLFNRYASPSSRNTLYLTEDSISDSTLLHQQLQEFLTTNWQVHIREVTQDPPPQSDETLSIFDILPAISMVAFILRAVYDFRASIIRLVGQRSSWFVGSMLILQIALCGVVHSVLHRSPLFFFHPQFGLFLIHPSARKQFWFEGVYFGSSSLLVSTAALSISHVTPFIKDEERVHELLRLAIFAIGTVYAFAYASFALKYRWLS
nr:conserved hypothetical protein [Albugo laibachii Nc14]|eukprot:CCA17706.1 conserved hypothetical protein [Albugo laibachii Nc14]